MLSELWERMVSSSKETVGDETIGNYALWGCLIRSEVLNLVKRLQNYLLRQQEGATERIW